MKKIITIIAVCATCLTLTACNTKSESADTVSGDQIPEDFSELKLVRTGMIDRRVYNDLGSLENYSDLAVVGEFIDDSEQDSIYEYEPYFEKEIMTIPRSFNTIKVTKVLMGDVSVGDNLKIAQLCAIHEGKLISFSDLTPMQKGDEWVFFLMKDPDGFYWCTGDSDGRYPTKNSASVNSRMALAASPELGVYDEANFKRYIYNEIIAKYDV